MAKKRPFGVTLLALLAGIAFFVAVIHTLQMLHLFPISGPFGEARFFTFDLLGALLWGVMAAIYLWVFRMLWNLDPQGWLFVVVIAVLNLILAFMSIIGNSTWQSMLPALVVNGLVLLYGLLPGTKAAFSIPAK
jgi:hypothetical protein